MRLQSLLKNQPICDVILEAQAIIKLGFTRQWTMQINAQIQIQIQPTHAEYMSRKDPKLSSGTHANCPAIATLECIPISKTTLVKRVQTHSPLVLRNSARIQRLKTPIHF
jgi:hypothetical protein